MIFVIDKLLLQPNGYLLFRDYATGDLAQVDMQSTNSFLFIFYVHAVGCCVCIFLFYFAICVQEFWGCDAFVKLIFMLALLISH